MKLKGIRVLDLSRFLPGPYLTLLMADHGAEVIKIESFDGETTRKLGPQVRGHSVYFRNTQRGKRSLRLNLKAAAGREIFLRLSDSADVIVDSFRPGVVDRLGIGYEAVRARNPGIVYCALSAFGQDGSFAARPSHDLGAQALTGVLSLGQANSAEPSLPAMPVADVALGSVALCGVLMALLRRTQSGEGDYLDAAMLDSLMSWTPHIVSSVIAEDRAPRLSEERLYGGAAFYNIYTTADGGSIVLSGAEMKFVENLLNALGRPDLIKICRAPWGPAQEPVKAFLRETFRTKTRDEWDAWLADKGVCYAPVLDLHEAWQSPRLRERGIVERGDDGVERLGTPLKFTREPGNTNGACASLGEHSDAILHELGYDEASIAELHATGVC